MITRRSALKSGFAALAGAGAVAAHAAAVGPKEKPACPVQRFDAVIIGAGTAGLVAAIEAHDLGLKPVVLEKMEYAAGNSLYASGGIAAWGTAQQ